MKPDTPDDPLAWLRHADSNLILAEKGGQLQGILLEDLCFNAQQAAEKALKALCVARNLEFPKTHSLVHLMDILETSGIEIPGNVREADVLTQYAVQSRYPGFSEEITGEEYRDVLALSARVVFWVKTLLGA